MGNIATLKPFKKGQSGNPAGRPKGAVSLVTKMREALDKIHDGTDKPYHAILIQSMLKDAIKTDGQSRKLILQYLEGMPHQTIEAEVKNVNYVITRGETTDPMQELQEESAKVEISTKED